MLKTESPGYYSFPVNFEVDSGYFYIVTKYETPGYEYPVPVEKSYPGYAEADIEQQGREWFLSDNNMWVSIGKGTKYEMDFCIRAFGGISIEKNNFKLDNTKFCLTDSIPINIYEQEKLNIFNEKFFWTFDVNKDEKITFLAPSPGYYSVELNGTQKINIFEVVAEPRIKIFTSDNISRFSRGKEITVIAFGAEDIYFPETEDYPKTYGSTLSFKIQQPELWVKAVVTIGNCIYSDSIFLESVFVPHDNISDALELSLDIEYGPFNNEYASVESAEPSPAEGNCNNQINWCEEGGVQNSLWFKFIAPISGEIRINSWGFDNQLALYEPLQTFNWEDIVSGESSRFKLIAANDDAHDNDYSAEITMKKGLVAGKTYFIQMDGSAGGVVGNAFIKLTTNPPSLKDFPIVVLGNPVKEYLTIDFRGLNLADYKILLFNEFGVPIKYWANNGFTFKENISDLASGVYLLKIVSSKQILKFSIIKL